MEKYLQVDVVDGANPCKSPSTGMVLNSQNVVINNIQFLNETGTEGAAGSIYDSTAYSTVKGTACISLTFILHASNPGVYTTPPPLYDKTAESAVFSTIMSTYANR